MLKRVIFAPEKKELRAESYTRGRADTTTLNAHCAGGSAPDERIEAL
jgi:hypothetical protein